MMTQGKCGVFYIYMTKVYLLCDFSHIL